MSEASFLGPFVNHIEAVFPDCHGCGWPSLRSPSGNRFILVICDYATCYPEAIPLRSVDAEHVAEELVKLFMRVEVPAEILTNQGRNFMLHLLVEVYHLHLI